MRTPNISRQKFLQQLTMAGAALLLSSLKSMAAGSSEKKIKVAVIGCGSVSNWKNFLGACALRPSRPHLVGFFL